MTSAITLQIVTGLIGLFTLWLRDYLANSKARDYEDKQKVRDIVVSGNATDVASVIDRLLSAERLQNSAAAGEPSAEDVEGRLGKL